MGNQSSHNTDSFDTRGYSKISEQEEDTIYGEIEVWQKNGKDNQLIKLAVSNNILHDLDEFNHAKDWCDNAVKQQHESIVQLNNVINGKQEEFCSTFYQISLLYEYLEINLRNDITQRYQVRQMYNEDELWHILVSVITALAFLKQQGYQHSDIRPSSILVNYEGKVKIMQRSCFQKKQDSYVEILTAKQSDNGVYLSPKLIQNLQQHQPVPQHDSYKTDIYTLALTLIECAQLAPLQDIYDLRKFTINSNIIQKSLQEISTRYSEQFVHFLSLMLEQDEDQRPQIEDLFQFLKSLFDQQVKMSDRLYTLNTNDKHTNHSPYQQVHQSPSPQKEVPAPPKQVEKKKEKVQKDSDLHPSDQEPKKVKRSKKCMTDDHDQAKLSRQPVVEGVDPRKDKKYTVLMNNFVNKFRDGTEDNRKVKRTAAFNTDNHDNAELTHAVKHDGVDPRIYEGFLSKFIRH